MIPAVSWDCIMLWKESKMRHRIHFKIYYYIFAQEKLKCIKQTQ